jgi:hypothetical protein
MEEEFDRGDSSSIKVQVSKSKCQRNIKVQISKRDFETSSECHPCHAELVSAFHLSVGFHLNLEL